MCAKFCCEHLFVDFYVYSQCCLFLIFLLLVIYLVFICAFEFFFFVRTLCTLSHPPCNDPKHEVDSIK